VADLTGMQPQQLQSVCGTATHRAHSHAHMPSGLLMVHAVLTLAIKIWLCGMTWV